MSGAGATIVGGEGVICQEAPDADAIEQCKALGKAACKRLIIEKFCVLAPEYFREKKCRIS